MGERAEKKETIGEKIDRLANLSDDEAIAEVRRIPDVQQRAILIRQIKARRQKWKENLKEAKAEEAKLPHNTAAAPGARDDIPRRNKVQFDDDSIITEESHGKHKPGGDAEKASASDTYTRTTTTQEGEVTDVKETAVKGSLGVSGASAGLERSKESRVGDEETGVSGKTTKSGDLSVDWEKGEGELKGGFEKEAKAGDRVNKSGGEGSLEYKDGHLRGGGSYKEEKQIVGKDGEVKGSQSSETSAHIGTESASVDTKSSLTNEYGTTHSVNVGGDVNWKEGSASATGGYSVKTKSGNEGHVSVSAGIKVEAEKPKKVGDHYEVSYTITKSASAGAGGKSHDVGIEVGGKDEHFETGTRSFKDEKEANEFKEHAAEKLKDAPNANTVEGAMKLEVGETRGSGDKIGGNISGSASIEGAKVGVGGHASKGDSFEVKRVSETIFEVTYTHSSEKGVEGSVGGGPISTSADSASDQHHKDTVEFDLSTDEGKQAFEQFQKDHKVPAKGGKKVSTEDGKGHTSHDGTKIAGLGSASYGRHTSETTITDAKGEHKKNEGEQSHDVDPTWVGKNIFGDDKVHSSVEIEARRENGKDDGYTVTGNVSGESGKYNRNKMQALAYGLREHENWDEHKAKASGDWTMTADIDKKTMHSLEKYSDRFKGKSQDDQMRALGEWVAEDGSKAVQSIERWGGKKLDWDLELKGDKNFPGRAGRLELEGKMHKYGEQLAHDPASSSSVVGAVDGEIAALKERRQAVASPEKYTDLPDTLRQQQLKIIDQQIAGFESLRHRALVEGSKNKPGEDVNQIAAREGQPGGEHEPLARLRDVIAQRDAGVAGYQKQNGDAIAAMKQAIGHLDGSKHNAATIASNSNKATTAAAAKDAAQRAAYLRLDDDRAALLKNAANPTVAVPIAQKIIGELDQQLLIAGEAQTLLYDAARKQVQVTTRAGLAGHAEFWKDVLESLDGDDFVDDDDDGSAPVQDDPEPPPAHVGLSLPSRKR